jgi:ASC-1-like (ASCH) protein
MDQSTEFWIRAIRDQLSTLRVDGPTGRQLGKILAAESPNGLHLAVFIEPYLSFIFEGKKTIESRFNMVKQAPFEQVSPGDVLVLKRSAGPVCGICLISNVWFYHVNPNTWREIEGFAAALCMDKSPFWEKRKASSFATLMQIENAITIPDIFIDKVDPRSWVVLLASSNLEQPSLF